MSATETQRRRGKGEGSIVRRGENRWLLKYELPRDPQTGERRTRYKTVKGTKTDARRELRKLLDTVDRGEHIDASKMTFSAWATTWLDVHAKPRVTARTLQGYRETLDWYATPTLGKLAMQKIGQSDIRSLCAKLLESGARKEGRDGSTRGLSAVTVGGVKRVLTLCFGDALRDNLIAKNPVAGVKLAAPKATRATSEQALDEEQLSTLLVTFNGHPLYPLVAMAIATGLRRSELLALRWTDCDLDGEKPTITVTRALEEVRAKGEKHSTVTLKAPKSASGNRRIAVDVSLVGLLKALRAEQETAQAKLLGATAGNVHVLRRELPRDALLFPVSPLTPEKPQSPNSVSRAFSRKANAAGFNVGLHALRHSHASVLLMHGAPATGVAQRLGHASVSTTTRVYAHTLARAEERAAELASNLMATLLSGPSKNGR